MGYVKYASPSDRQEAEQHGHWFERHEFKQIGSNRNRKHLKQLRIVQSLVRVIQKKIKLNSKPK